MLKLHSLLRGKMNLLVLGYPITRPPGREAAPQPGSTKLIDTVNNGRINKAHDVPLNPINLHCQSLHSLVSLTKRTLGMLKLICVLNNVFTIHTVDAYSVCV